MQAALLRKCAFTVVGLAALVWTAGAVARAQTGQRFALLVQGASGEETYATLHRGWLNSLASLLRDKYHYDATHLVVLAEQPADGEAKSTAESVRQALTRLATAVGPDDQLVVVLIGHGTSDAAGAKFNLVGPDLTVADWAALLKPVRGHLAVIDTTSGSFPFLTGLSAPDRVVITATNSPAQRYHTVFPEEFIAALSNADADLDKNGRVSLLEAFTTASRAVKQHYEQAGTMATEVAALDDNGDGTPFVVGASGPAAAAAGRGGAPGAAKAPATDGDVAAVTYFDAQTASTSADPALQQLLNRQQTLTQQIDDLRRRRASMPADQFDRELDRLLTELATVSSEIRQKGGK